MYSDDVYLKEKLYENLFLLECACEKAGEIYFFCAWEQSVEQLLEIFRDYLDQYQLQAEMQYSPMVIVAFEGNKLRFYQIANNGLTCNSIQNRDSPEFHWYMDDMKRIELLSIVAKSHCNCTLSAEREKSRMFDFIDYSGTKIHVFVSRKCGENHK